MKKVDAINRDLFLKLQFVSIGTLSDRVRSVLAEHRPDILAKIPEGQDIVFWNNRINHTESHKDGFQSDNFFEYCLESIPRFIKEPDYLSAKKDGSSISFIKCLEQNITIAIRIATDGKLSFRTMYPITSAQLDNYLDSDTAWKI